MNTVAEKPNQNAAVAELPYAAPDVNIYETEQGFMLQAEMPGVTREGLEVTLEGTTLMFVGRRNDGESHGKALGKALYQESRPLNYRRAFELAPEIDVNKIHAEMHQGVLTLTLPKAERVQPRRIEIQ